jgi:P-type Cu+ transporter
MNERAHHHASGRAGASDTQSIDPVCGMRIDAETPYRYTFQGREFRFCSERCRERFMAAPTQYLKKADAETSSQATTISTHDHSNRAKGNEASTMGVGAGAPTPRTATEEGGSRVTIYTCPMHPQIRRSAPGNCPICGMALEPEMPTVEEERNPELEDFTRRFWWTLPLSVLGVVIAMGGHRFMPLAPATMSWLEFALATPVVLWAGWPFFVRCIDSIRHRSPNMWTLIGIGVAAAYVYSVLGTVAPGLFPEEFGYRLTHAAWADTRAARPLANISGHSVATRIATKNRAAYSIRWDGRGYSARQRANRRHAAHSSGRESAG